MSLPSSTSRAVCAICGAARRLGAPRNGARGVLCDSVACAWQLSRLPADQKCRVCSTPLSQWQRAEGVCDDAACRDEWLVQRPKRGIATAHSERLERAREKRTLWAMRKGYSREEAETLRLVVLPRHYGRARPLPRARVRAFEANLRKHLQEARTNAPSDAGDPIDTPVPDMRTRTSATQEAEAQLLVRGCTACRGFCCRGGTNHAFLSRSALAAQLERHPEISDDTLVSRYLSYLPTAVLPDSCVYHGAKGCTLPRDMRSDTCNNFWCHGLGTVRNTFGDDDPVRAFIMHRSGQHFHGGMLVEIRRAER